MLRIALAVTSLFSAAVSSNAASAQEQSQNSASDPAAIVVVGDRAEQAEIAADQAKVITLRQPIDNPLPRRYAPICVKVFGIDPAYGDLIAEQVRKNARVLGRSVAKPGCQPNVWVGFFSNSKAEVERLRKKDPVMFESLTSFEVDQIFSGSSAAQAWHATEIKSADGRPIPIIEIELDGRKAEVKYNSQYSGGRLNSPIRNDINGTIVIFDRKLANGKTGQQLADYATFRIFAPVQDFAEASPGAMPSILQLFTPGASPPDGLTEFDWAYLSAYYKLGHGAKASALHDATKRTMLDGTGQRLREKAASE